MKLRESQTVLCEGSPTDQLSQVMLPARDSAPPKRQGQQARSKGEE